MHTENGVHVKLSAICYLCWNGKFTATQRDERHSRHDSYCRWNRHVQAWSNETKILKAYNAENVALSFDEVANANQAKIRELIQGKNIVYIYHNQVDARGDKAASENEVFNACAEAIDEIHRLIKRLTGYVSAPKFFITADHGFLYKRDKLQEFDKVSYAER